MNFRQLELFVAIAETGSISRGAEAVALAQSTVSQHVAALEEETGVRLLDRSGRGVFLTSGGELFLHHARRVVAERDALLQTMYAFQGLDRAQLTIGASNVPANYLVPQLLPVLKRRHPGVMLSMISGDSANILERLENSEVEVAIVGSRSGQKGLSFTPVMNDPLVLVVAANHRWSTVKKIGLEELAAEPLVVRETGSGSGQALDHALRQTGIDPSGLEVAVRLGSNEAVLQAVAGGCGCAFVSALSARQALKVKELAVVEVEGLAVSRQIWLAQVAARSASPAAQAFKDTLLTVYS